MHACHTLKKSFNFTECYSNIPKWQHIFKVKFGHFGAMFAAILNIMPSETLIHKWKTTVRLSKYSRCPLTSNYIKIFAKSISYNDYLFFGGHLGRHLEFLKTLKGAKPAPDGILKSNVSPFRKYQNIYYTLPCHVRLKYIKYLPYYQAIIHL